MCGALVLSLSLFLFIRLSQVRCQFTVPEATLEFLNPKGLKISIPDTDPDVTLVAFHVNVNEEFYGVEHGQWAADILKKREGRWTYIIKDFRVKQGDTIYYWVYAIKDGLGYQALDKSYKVTQANPHGSQNVPPPPAPSPTTPPPPPPTTSTSDRVTSPPHSCTGVSLTTYAGGRQTCKDEVILNEQFNSLDKWIHQIQIGGSQLEDEFTIFTQDSEIAFIENNEIVIKPILLEQKYNENFVRTGTLTMDGCTSTIPEQCTKVAQSYLILPPIVSARLSTRNRFTFQYGTVEIVAKLPRGDWIVPELWLEPLQPSPGSSGHIVLAHYRGNQELGGQLEAGVQMGSFSELGRRTQSSPWSDRYHKFKLIWTPEKLEFSVDGENISKMESREEIRSNEFFLVLGVHVAGSKDFPDNLPNKPWKNTDPKRFVKFWESKDSWLPTWDENSALRVKSVTVTAL